MGHASRDKQGQQELTHAQHYRLGRSKFSEQGDVALHAKLNGTMHYV
jgi:hypothetical protein